MPLFTSSSAALNSRATLVWVLVFESRQRLSSASLLFVPSKNSVMLSVCWHDILGSTTRMRPVVHASSLCDSRPLSGIGSGHFRVMVQLLAPLHWEIDDSIRHRAR